MVTLTTPEKVEEVTGTAVDAADITRAQAVIGLATGVDLDADSLPYATRDVRHLTSAVIWQTSFMKTHAEQVAEAMVAVRSAVSASANGVSVNYGEAIRGTLNGIVAPLAGMALRRLSWRGSRSVRMVPSRRAVLRAQTLLLDGDDAEWRRL
jgi:hypothetical protein